MTMYDSSTDARSNIAANGSTTSLGATVDATRDRLLDSTGTQSGSKVKQALDAAPAKARQAGQAVRSRPRTTAVTTLLLIVATVAGTVGARKIAEARRPRNRWQAMLRR